MIKKKTFCKNCLAWKPREDLRQNAKTGENCIFGECHKKAPRAEATWGTKNYYDRSLILWVLWPIAMGEDFCFEGEPNVRIPGLDR